MLGTTASILFLTFSLMTEATTLSDSLVQNLSCENISAESILHSIPASSFAQTLENPQANWGFSDGPVNLAACWSLAHAQRLFYYLARFSAPEQPHFPLRQVLNLLRGADPYAFSDGPIQEWGEVDMTPFSIPLEQWQDIQSPFWQMLSQGLQDPMDNGRILPRDFQSEIQFYQIWRLGDILGNLQYIEADGPRSAASNVQTAQSLGANLQMQHLTILVLRPLRFSQHVVLAKSSVQDTQGNIIFQVYDSNSPGADQSLTFQASDSQFYGAAIVNGLPGVTNPAAPLGVFIADEDDFSQITASLVEYYQNQCASNKSPHP